MADERMQDLSARRNDAVNDNKNADNDRSLLSDIAMGLRFYSRIPVPAIPHEVPELNRIAPALGFTGVALGLLPAVALVVLSALGVPTFVTAAFAVGAFAIITGAMAEDALADSADGLFGGTSIGTRLAILEDSRHGTYGVLALVLFLLSRVGALSAALAVSPLATACIWLAATTLARSGALWMPLVLPSARLDGNSATVGRLNSTPFFAGLGISVVLTLLLAAPFVGIWGVTLGLVAGAAIAFGWQKVCARLLGGQTGDLIGALQALLEIALLTLFVTMAV